jgi:hypothetical protein
MAGYDLWVDFAAMADDGRLWTTPPTSAPACG